MESKKVFKIYKLEVEYPGSPKKNTVVIESYENYYSPISSLIFSDKKLIENYPNNWKLVKEPIFKMISVIDSVGYVSKGKEVLYRYMYGGYTDHKIYSIVRSSDNEEFTVGDEIDTTKSKNVIIECFKITENSLFIKHNKGLLALSLKVSNSFEEIKKSKLPLFTTEDGVDIFEGDKYTFIWINRPAHNQNILTTYTKIAKKLKKEESWSESAKFFSTKGKAEEYIKMNKKDFSRNQIIAFLDKMHVGDAIINFFINELDKQ